MLNKTVKKRQDVGLRERSNPSTLTESHFSSDPLGGVKNLQVIDPTTSTLTVRWDPAVGNVRSYKVFYAAQPGGEEQMVGRVHTF